MGKTKQEKDPVFNALKLEREDIGPNSRGDMSKVLITFSSNLDQILKSCPVWEATKYSDKFIYIKTPPT